MEKQPWNENELLVYFEENSKSSQEKAEEAAESNESLNQGIENLFLQEKQKKQSKSGSQEPTLLDKVKTGARDIHYKAAIHNEPRSSDPNISLWSNPKDEKGHCTPRKASHSFRICEELPNDSSSHFPKKRRNCQSAPTTPQYAQDLSKNKRPCSVPPIIDFNQSLNVVGRESIDFASITSKLFFSDNTNITPIRHDGTVMLPLEKGSVFHPIPINLQRSQSAEACSENIVTTVEPQNVLHGGDDVSLISEKSLLNEARSHLHADIMEEKNETVLFHWNAFSSHNEFIKLSSPEPEVRVHLNSKKKQTTKKAHQLKYTEPLSGFDATYRPIERVRYSAFLCENNDNYSFS